MVRRRRAAGVTGGPRARINAGTGPTPIRGGRGLRHLVVCCDGTWQDVAQHSNVSRLHQAVVTPPDDPEPLYVKGVGVSTNPVDVLRGGLTGAGLSASIKDGYRWLVREFRHGDRAAIFGFSRGAYTARSLAGM